MNGTSTRVEKWPHPEPPGEDQVRRILAAEGISAYRWSNAPGDTYAAHSHAYHKVIYVIQGSITFGLPDLGKVIELQPGDRLELPAGVLHDAVVGPRGVVCLEAHR
jgi:quercetin dioxygenase-like cupin family protein